LVKLSLLLIQLLNNLLVFKKLRNLNFFTFKKRLIRTVGKSLAMEMNLSGEPINAQQALQSGLVSKVCAPDELLEEAHKTASKIASMSQLIVGICKEAVNVGLESTLSEGLRFERRQFHATFATYDRKEGMDAFANKRKAEFKNC